MALIRRGMIMLDTDNGDMRGGGRGEKGNKYCNVIKYPILVTVHLWGSRKTTQHCNIFQLLKL